ncbi:MAG: GAF domain-containing sensor histidine kinase, partial [Flavobacteriaceae bacterium]|nr:GAF domain-containing sensor histidine kinase [Flavobacteriaceae bacterium]
MLTIDQKEQKRLASLRKYEILYTEKNPDFDNIADIARGIFNTEIGLISFIDKEKAWYKSALGLNLCDANREDTFCNQVIQSDDLRLIITNALSDERVNQLPSVKNIPKPILFYAGVAIKDSDGLPIGTLCVADFEVKSIDEKQILQLEALAQQIYNLVELHKTNKVLKRSESWLKSKNNMLKEFAGTVSHDMKMPLANMILLSDMLKKKYAGKIDEVGSEYINQIKENALSLSDYISNILNYYESEELEQNAPESFDLNSLLEEVVDMLKITCDCQFSFPEENIEITAYRAALEQIFINLIGNSIKYNDKSKIKISVDAHEDEENYFFTISDNGIGIPPDKISDIFELFKTLDTPDRFGRKGHGIGLSTVKKILDQLNGFIHVESTPGKGSRFS